MRATALLLLLPLNGATARASSKARPDRIVAEGVWEFGTERERPGARHICPLTSNLTAPRYEGSSFNAKAYLKAEFRPEGRHHMMSIPESLALLGKRVSLPLRVTYVGDCISQNMYFSALCSVEAMNYKIQPVYQYSRYLQTNPCGCKSEAKCIRGDDFHDWDKLRNDTHVVVVQAGTWHGGRNTPKSCISDREMEDFYYKSVEAVVPVLRAHAERGAVVLWVGLVYASSAMPERRFLTTFRRRNDRVADILRGTGIIFVDLYNATRARFERDPMIRCDDLHYCGFGPNSITWFANELVLQIAARLSHHF